MNIQEQFKITQNIDLKRWEFLSKDNNSCSYTVAFYEASSLDDAIISVYLASKKNPQ